MESAGTMSKHSSFFVNNQNAENGEESEESEKQNKPVETQKKAAQKTKTVVLMVNTNYKITGKYSGQVYFFNGAGSRQEVDETDVDWILSLSRGNVCCGGGTRGKLFALAEV